MARNTHFVRSSVHSPVHAFVHKKAIEDGALVLLAEYGRKYHVVIQPPVPVEGIIEAHLGLTFDIEDLPRLLNVRDVLGATWFRSREVKIDQSLDPTVFPSKLGRYRFTVAHEIGHWELHRQRYLSVEGQAAMFAGEDRPVVCRSNDRSPLEWQADCFAGYLLMPKEMVYAQWESIYGSREPYVAADEIADLKARWGLGIDERPTVEAARQLAPVFEVTLCKTPSITHSSQAQCFDCATGLRVSGIGTDKRSIDNREPAMTATVFPTGSFQRNE